MRKRQKEEEKVEDMQRKRQKEEEKVEDMQRKTEEKDSAPSRIPIPSTTRYTDAFPSWRSAS